MALYEYPARTFFLRGLSLPAVHTHAVLVPAARALVRFVVCVILDGCEYLPCVGAGIADSGAVHFPAAEPLVWCDNFAVVPMQVSVVLPLSLLRAERMHVVPVPVALASVFCAIKYPVWCAQFLCAVAAYPVFGAGM